MWSCPPQTRKPPRETAAAFLLHAWPRMDFRHRRSLPRQHTRACLLRAGPARPLRSGKNPHPAGLPLARPLPARLAFPRIATSAVPHRMADISRRKKHQGRQPMQRYGLSAISRSHRSRAGIRRAGRRADQAQHRHFLRRHQSSGVDRARQGFLQERGARRPARSHPRLAGGDGRHDVGQISVRLRRARQHHRLYRRPGRREDRQLRSRRHPRRAFRYEQHRLAAGDQEPQGSEGQDCRGRRRQQRLWPRDVQDSRR